MPPPVPDAAHADKAWGSLGESGSQIDMVLQFMSSVAFARAGTAVLKASGYQVLDSAGTGALKKACEGKPPAASVGLVPRGTHQYIATGPIKPNSPDDKRSLGFSAFNSLSGGGKMLSVRFPLYSGIKPTDSAIRTSAAQSPLWKLPTRMMVGFNSNDEVDARIEWLDDLATAKEFKTATWVVRDRFLSQKINMSDANWVVAAVTGALVNALKMKIGGQSEGSGSLWWQGYPEIVTPSALGLSYALLTPTLPLFSASKVDWNKRGWSSVQQLEAPGAQPGEMADYMIVQPKYDKEPANFLRSLPSGLDSLQDYGLPTQLGFLYAVVMPKELLVARTQQLNDKTWLSVALNVKPPIAKAPQRRSDAVGWKCDKDALNLSVALAHNVTDKVSMSLGYKQTFSWTGLESVHEKGGQKLGLHRSGNVETYAALVWKFAGGSLQVASEGMHKLAAMFESQVPSSEAIKLHAGFRWSKNERLHYGAGITAQL